MNRTERQKEGIRKWIANRYCGTALYPTGFGKTRTAILAIKLFLSKNANHKVLVVVPTDYLKDQWTEQVLTEGLFNSVTVRVINTVIKNEWEVSMLVLDDHLSR